MVQQEVLHLNIDLLESGEAPAVYHTLNITATGKPEDKLSLTYVSVSDVIQGARGIPKYIISDDEVLSILLTREVGTSNAHYAFLSLLGGVIGYGLGYSPEFVEVGWSDSFKQYMNDLIAQEIESGRNPEHLTKLPEGPIPLRAL